MSLKLQGDNYWKAGYMDGWNLLERDLFEARNEEYKAGWKVGLEDRQSGLRPSPWQIRCLVQQELFNG